MTLKLLQRITHDPDLCHGKPCIRGLRYPIEFILEQNSELEILFATYLSNIIDLLSQYSYIEISRDMIIIHQ
jgi:uncharacterized protein (DUF433 family)